MTFGDPRAQNLGFYESKEGLEELVQWNFGPQEQAAAAGWWARGEGI